MKKLFSFTIGAAVTAAATAAPLAPLPMTELLGLRSASTPPLNEAFSAYGAASLAPVAAPAKISGLDTSDPTKAYIVGCVVSPDHITGMWSYTTDTWEPARLTTNANQVFASGGGLAASDGYYYDTEYREAMGFEEIKSRNYDMNNEWAKYDEYTGQISVVATTMAYCPNRDQAFGCFVNEDRTGYVFCEFNYSYFSIKRTICEIETDKVWAGSAFSSDNTLYAITRTGDLYTVDLKSGAMTLVGSTGIETKYLADAAIDTETDKMYWCVNTDEENALYTIDIKTAAATKLYDLKNQEQICGMFIARASEATPATAPSEISSSPSLSFSGTSLTGKISFSLPNYQFDQQAKLDADTDLTWVVCANGKEIARGTGKPGTRVNADITVDTPDSYYFTIVVSNEAGSSPAKGTKKYIGPDTPKAPTSFQVKINGSAITLNWGSPSSSGVNGGTVAYSSATYTVVRYPDMKKIVDNEAVRTATDEIPASDEKIDYYYVLTATVEGLTSEEKKSSVIPTGPITPPETLAFENANSLFGWTITEGEPADNNMWVYYDYDKALRISASTKEHDDYAISPAVIVKGGSSYPFSIDIKTSNYYEETFEVLWGTEPTIEAMTNTAIAESKQKSSNYFTYTGKINTVADGKIYFAVHDKTSGTASQIYFRNIVIGDGVITKAPSAVTFSVKPETDGTPKATITYTLPTVDLEGNAFDEASALTKVEFIRDGEVISTLSENLPTEADATFIDEEGLTLGKHAYKVVAYNAYGAGASEAVEVLVGPGKPAAPANPLMLEEGNTGKVTISWDAVTADENGNPILPSAITYKVVDRNYNVVGEGLTETSLTVQSVEEGKQEFRQYGIYAVTVGGESKLAGTAYKPVGTPYPTPWAESFADGGVSSIFGFNYISGNEPWQFGQEPEWTAPAQDGDNGYAYLESYGTDQTALVTGKIDLSGISNPAITYYTYRYNDNDYSNEFSVEVDCGDGNGFVVVQSDPIYVGEPSTWHKVVVDLSDYDGKSVVFRFNPTAPQPHNKCAFFHLDNIRVTSHSDYNLTASRIEAPTVTKANEEFEINVIISNTGDMEARGYDVELWSGEDFIDSKKGPAIASEASATVTFVTSNDVLAGETRDYHAVIIFSEDEVESDNTTGIATVGIVAAPVPAPSGLVASQDGSSVSLQWTEPDLAAGAPAPYTETFETADAWAQTVEGWKMVDGDQAPLISINNPKFLFGAGKLASWWITDQNWDGENEASVELWKAHGGTKFLVSGSVMSGNQPIQCDDWAISPRLFGCEQIISFYARSFYGAGNYAGYYQEDFEVLYSTSTTNVADFVSAGEVKKAPFAWTKYSFRLPAGALYFAIRSRSTDQFFLFIDDVTYIPATGEAAQRTVKGYNIYRDGRKLNTDLVTSTSYTDDAVRSEGDHTYVVTAVYAEGESRPSNEASLTYSGIGTAATGALSIVGGEGFISVAGANGADITVYNAAGVAVASRRGENAVRFTLPGGIYIVRAGEAAAKVAVK